MADLLVDTDIFIDHLRGARVIPWQHNRVFYSVVTRAELFAGSKVNERDVREVLSGFTEIAVDRALAEVAGRLRRRVQLALPDALVAATALEHRLALATRNLRHFSHVPGLQMFDLPS